MGVGDHIFDHCISSLPEMSNPDGLELPQGEVYKEVEPYKEELISKEVEVQELPLG